DTAVDVVAGGDADVEGGHRSARLRGEHPAVLVESFDDGDQRGVGHGIGVGEVVQRDVGGRGDTVDDRGQLGDGLAIAEAPGRELPVAGGDGTGPGIDG